MAASRRWRTSTDGPGREAARPRGCDAVTLFCAARRVCVCLSLSPARCSPRPTLCSPPPPPALGPRRRRRCLVPSAAASAPGRLHPAWPSHHCCHAAAGTTRKPALCHLLRRVPFPAPSSEAAFQRGRRPAEEQCAPGRSEWQGCPSTVWAHKASAGARRRRVEGQASEHLAGGQTGKRSCWAAKGC